MKIKKSDKADLEKERPVYFLMGIIVVLSSFFVVLEWQNSPPEYPDWQALVPVFVENEYVSPFEQKQEKEVIIEQAQSDVAYEDFQITDEIKETPVTEKTENSTIVSKSDETIEEKHLSQQETANGNESTEEPPVYTEDVDVMPQFLGGTTELIRFIYNHIEYPPIALKHRIEGRVWCSIIINQDGSVSHVRLEKGVYALLDEEALRVLKLLPSWTPGTKNNKPVKVKIYIPIVFKR